MTLYFEDEGDITLSLGCEALASNVIEASLSYMDCPYEAEVSLLLTTNDAIKEMNCEFRNIDQPTDVLSFPMIEYDVAGEFSFLETDMSAFHPESGELILGDIIISKEKVIEQAHVYGHSLEREYAFLIVHSMLHLMGFDHMTDEERLIMEQKQNEIMNLLNILR